MAIRIFETDPDARPAPRPTYSDGVAFKLRSGRQVNDLPVSLAAWRVTANERATADAVVQLYGGTVAEWETSKEDHYEVLTEADKIPIVINGAAAIRSKLVLWGRQGPIHECDGVQFLSPEEDAGKPCGCPALLVDRKAQAKSGRGPAPHTTVTFHLADDYDLGEGSFTSTSWELVKVLHEVENALDEVDGEALCELSLEHVSFTTKSGQAVEYRKPVIKVLKAWNDAVADEPPY